MHPADIQAALKKAGITQKKVPMSWGVTTFHVSEVVRKKRVSDPVMRFIASKLGKSHYEVSPEYYFGPKKRSTAKAVNSSLEKQGYC